MATIITKFEDVDLFIFSPDDIEKLCKYLLHYVDVALATNMRLIERLEEDPHNARAIIGFWCAYCNQMNEQLAHYIADLSSGGAGQRMQ